MTYDLYDMADGKVENMQMKRMVSDLRDLDEDIDVMVNTDDDEIRIEFPASGELRKEIEWLQGTHEYRDVVGQSEDDGNQILVVADSSEDLDW